MITKASHVEKENLSVSKTDGKYVILTFVSFIRLILNYLVAAFCESVEIFIESLLIRWTSGLVTICSTKASNEIGGWRFGRYAG